MMKNDIHNYTFAGIDVSHLKKDPKKEDYEWVKVKYKWIRVKKEKSNEERS